MKGLTIWQPNASAIAVRAKTIETRPMKTHYRGPVAIHAAKSTRYAEEFNAEIDADIHNLELWRRVLAGILCHATRLDSEMTFGAFVAVADLVDCRPAESFTDDELDRPNAVTGDYVPPSRYTLTNRRLGDFRPGRWGWVLDNIRKVVPAIPWRGQQGLFPLDGRHGWRCTRMKISDPCNCGIDRILAMGADDEE